MLTLVLRQYVVFLFVSRKLFRMSLVMVVRRMLCSVRSSLCAVLSVSSTQHSSQYTHHTCDMMPHHRITYNDVVFTESYPKYNFTYGQVKAP